MANNDPTPITSSRLAAQNLGHDSNLAMVASIEEAAAQKTIPEVDLAKVILVHSAQLNAQ